MYGSRVLREVRSHVAGRGVGVEPTDSPPLQLLDGGAVGIVKDLLVEREELLIRERLRRRR
ncbi:hypothetical protein HX89_03750 [Dermacoccus nishinomiyaensis]|uniref:Uncharacterized protein n=1 Tax=Dermacoccus nishinomiyaensis TaxID=1274 RepID=A0A075JFZ8_9MICO|nr:hypothetical protein HX89_03750 [Dermacoccus nishinomiyaensis]